MGVFILVFRLLPSLRKAVNHTAVSVGGAQLLVRSCPLPWLDNPPVPVRNLNGLVEERVEKVRKNKNGRQVLRYSWSIMSPFTHSDILVVTGLRSRPLAKLLRKIISQALGLEDAHSIDAGVD